MDWIRANKSLATILGVVIAGALGLIVYGYLAYSSYSDSTESLQALAKKVANMEKAKLYPSEANVEAKSEKVSAYEDEVGKLGTVLLSLQKEVTSKPITDTEFQGRLKQRIAEVRELSKDALQKDFAFGFDSYTRTLPSADSVQDLNDYFDGVDAIVSAALAAGTKKIDLLTRSDLAVEKGGGKPKVKKVAAPPPAPKPTAGKNKKGAKGNVKAAPKPAAPVAQVVERRTVTLDITTDQAPLQTLVNTLSSATLMKHFTVLRLLRIENEKTEGPPSRAAAATGNSGLKTLNKEGLVDPVPAEPEAPAAGSTTPAATTPGTPAAPGAPAAAPKVEVIKAATPAPPDSVKVLGGELLKAHLEIDLIRFLEPESEAAPAEPAK